jgi:hypothetical protein
MFIKKICLTVLVLTVFVSCGIANVAYIDGYDVHDEKMKPWDHGWLEVSANGQYLQHEDDGTPLFWWFDTAWTAPSRLDLDDLRIWFADRQEKGYTGLMMAMLGFGGNYFYNDPSDNLVNGTLPFLNDNPATPNPDYFQYVADVINLAAEYNFYVAFLVSVQDYICDDDTNPGPFTTSNAYTYGQWIGDFFKDDPDTQWREFPNLIYMVGGDMDIDCTSTSPTIIENIVEGIKNKDTKHLVTAHPNGRSLTNEWPTLEAKLDFGTFQSRDSCCALNDTYGMAYTAYKQNKAYVISEPHYCPEGPYVLTDVDMRSQPWFVWLRGTKGYTSGVRYLWDVFIEALGEDGNEFGQWPGEGHDWDWYLDNSTCNSYQVLAHQLLKKFNWHKLVPDQNIITNNNSPSDVWHKRTAAYSSDGDFMLIYVPNESDPTTTLEINLNGYITAAPYALVRLWRASDGFERDEGIETTNTSHSISLPSWDGTLVIVEAIDTYHGNPDKTSNARYKTDTYHGYFEVP